MDVHEEDDDDDEDEDEEPPSFSRIDAKSLHAKKIPEEFPLLANATKITFALNEGEMLYLPASWFHEVRSHGPRATNSSDSETPSPAQHMALNYWYHPPATSVAHMPYEDVFWEDRWNELHDLLEKDQQRSKDEEEEDDDDDDGGERRRTFAEM
ncbi:hypothetical protein HK101_006576, partial [Irineochytrium annulatum]